MIYKAAIFTLAATSVNAFAGQGSGGGLGTKVIEMESAVMPVEFRELPIPADDMRRLKARLAVSGTAEVQTDEGVMLAKKHEEKIVDSSEHIEFVSETGPDTP